MSQRDMSQRAAAFERRFRDSPGVFLRTCLIGASLTAVLVTWLAPSRRYRDKRMRSRPRRELRHRHQTFPESGHGMWEAAFKFLDGLRAQTSFLTPRSQSRR